MKICGIGIDLVELKRSSGFVRRFGGSLKSFFLPHEYRFYQKAKSKSRAFAFLFSAKEASSKALGVSVMHPRQFREFSVVRDGRKWICRYRRNRCSRSVISIELRPFEYPDAMGVLAVRRA